MKKPKIFLSYAKEDKTIAKKLCFELRKESIEVWFDEDSLVGGQKWHDAIKKAIQESDFFVVLLSNASVSKRGTIQKEIRSAIEILESFPENQIFIIPIRLNECKPTFQILNEIHWVDLFRDWDLGIHQILRAINSDSFVHQSILGSTPFEKALTTLDMVIPQEKPKPVRISEVLHQAIISFESYADLKGVSIILRDKSGGLKIKINPKAFKLAILNLLHNAVKYSYSSKRKKGFVVVNLEEKNNIVEISVENVGIPLTEDDFFRIRSRDYEAKFSIDKKGTGIGFGLWVVAQVVEEGFGKFNLVSMPIRKSTRGQIVPCNTIITLSLPAIKSREIKDSDFVVLNLNDSKLKKLN